MPGVWWVNWGPQDEGDSVRAIHAALDGGVNWIDTAPFYGWGRAEEVVARAVRGRDDVLIFTKCGTMRGGDGDDFMDLRPGGDPRRRRGQPAPARGRAARPAPAARPRSDVPVEDPGARCFELVAEGKVRHGGISNHRADEIERALAVGPVSAAAVISTCALEARRARSTDPDRSALERVPGVIVAGPPLCNGGARATASAVGALAHRRELCGRTATRSRSAATSPDE